MAGFRNQRGHVVNQLGTKLLLVGLVAVILVFGTAEPFTAKHLLILLTALLVVFGTPWLKALLVRLQIM